MTDPYKVLGVSRDASEEEIKKHIAILRANIIPIIMPQVRLPTSHRKNEGNKRGI